MATAALQPLSILVVEDEQRLREMLAAAFSRLGHAVTAVADGRMALDMTARREFDVVLLDVALGEGPDGYDVCRLLRARRETVPIIMLTARDAEVDAVEGLEAGADDYVTKPFGLLELRSRINAVLRRSRPPSGANGVVRVAGVELRRGARTVAVRGRPVKLTLYEFELLARLLSDPGRAFNRQQLLRAIWGDSAYRDPRAIDVHIRHLRAKLEERPEEPRLIVTVPGVGYRFREP
jgi:DNA-binding response OmpR family regulator